MLKSIVFLAARYLREHWMRDLLCLLAVAAVTVLFYVGDLSSLPARRVPAYLGDLRSGMMVWWIVVSTVYALFTAFYGYGDPSRCYATLLLPARGEEKYAWEWLRTLVIFPSLVLLIIIGTDALAVHWLVQARPLLADKIDDVCSLWQRVVATGEPLNYIPYNIYLLVWLNSAALLARSGIRTWAAMLTIVVALAAVLTFPWSSERSLLYPFVWVEMEHAYAVSWTMPVSWCSRMAGYVISYVWYAALPVTVYVLSYLKFKEREI